MDLMTRYYDDALRIYAICGDKDLSDDDARLLAYMHVKACESGKGIDYFDDPSPNDKDAIAVLLGETMIADSMVTAKGEVVTLGNGAVSGAHNALRALDERLEADHGMEQRFSGELRSRLRLYRDQQFRVKMTQLYRQQIAPALFSYDRSAVDRAFGDYRKKKAREQDALQEMLNGPDAVERMTDSE